MPVVGVGPEYGYSLGRRLGGSPGVVKMFDVDVDDEVKGGKDQDLYGIGGDGKAFICISTRQVVTGVREGMMESFQCGRAWHGLDHGVVC